MTVVRETLNCETAAAWESWLEANSATSDGVRLAIAKKGGAHASVSYAQALDTALCFGWIDGQKWSVDEHHFLQGFGPRRPRSTWSQINRDKVAALVQSGRMRPAGLAEIERAKADGRWDAAYAAQSRTELPDDLAAAIAASPAASAFYPTLSSQNRFAIIFRTNGVKRADTRARKIAQFVQMLERGETIYPQR
ncbi:YdeI/OmpD-associated family protein [soil metagenome]